MSDLHQAFNDITHIIRTELAPIFKRGTQLTVIARMPGNDEADVLVSSDNLDEVVKLIERSKARDDFPGGPF